MIIDIETADHAYAMEEAAERKYHDEHEDVGPEDEDDLDDEDEEDFEDWEDYDEEMRHREWQEELFFPSPEEVWG